MSFRTKYRITVLVLVLSLAGAVHSIMTIQREGFMGVSMVPGMIMLFGSVVTGLAVAVLYHYYKARRDDTRDQQQVAAETLAKLATRGQKEKARKP